MPALNFQKQLAPKVESGEKRQTIRALRKDGRDPKIGDILFLYTGMRTKGCRKLGEEKAKEVQDISIYSGAAVAVDGVSLCRGEVKELAVADGFSCLKDFRNFFQRTHGLPFKGKLIKW